jgi:hypothetical protein
MAAIKLGGSAVLALVAVGVAGAAALWVWKKGGVFGALNAGLTGAVDTASEALGIPTTKQTTTDAGVARWLIDYFGQYEASKWASAYAYARAQLMSAGTGTPPASDSPVGIEFLPRWFPQSTPWDETDRLLARYPNHAAPDRIYSGYTTTPGFNPAEEMGFPL